MSTATNLTTTHTRRLIEDWLPIVEIGIESLRERTPMTPFPAPNRLHVWWARRPLVASRAAILASLLPPATSKETLLHLLGIHGDPLKAKVRIVKATEEGVRLGADAYGYSRAFTYLPTSEDLAEIEGEHTILDPTAGGGSIPFEAIRLRLAAVANDLNPVAGLILRATVEFPATFGSLLLQRYNQLGTDFRRQVCERIASLYPKEPDDLICDGYLWARTVTCPYCSGVVPLSPNWKLSKSGKGVRLLPETHGKRRIRFEIVDRPKDHGKATVKDGTGLCPFPDCQRTIDGDEIKRQA